MHIWKLVIREAQRCTEVTGERGLRNTQPRSGLRSGVPENRRSGPGLRSDLTCDLLGEDGGCILLPNRTVHRISQVLVCD